MTATTHQMLGAIVALSYIQHTGQTVYYPVIFSLAGSLIVDIDEPNSKIGSKAKNLARFTKKIFGHRTLTHSLLGMVLFSFLVDKISRNFNLPYLTDFFILGYLSHLLGDLLTVAGVKLFYPFPSDYSIPLVKTGNGIERIIQAFLTLILLYQIGLTFNMNFLKVFLK